MAIRFTISRRGLLPNEKGESSAVNQTNNGEGVTLQDAANQHLTDEQWLKSLRPRVDEGAVVDAAEFQNSDYRLPSTLPHGELLNAMDVMRRVMLHEMEKGNAVVLPGIGTFRLSLKGGIEVREVRNEDGTNRAYYHGKDVCVNSILFHPDRELLEDVRQFEVEQSPFGRAFHTEEEDIEERLTALFAKQESITHRDVSFAFEKTLTRSRIASLLKRLTEEGRLIREGSKSQTRYHAAAGQFGRE